MSDIEKFAGMIRNSKIVSGVLVGELASGDFVLQEGEMFPPITRQMLHFVVRRGCMSVCVDNIVYECSGSENNLMDIKPVNTVTSVSIGEDFDGYVIVISNDFFENVYKGRRILKMHDMHTLRNNLTATVTPEGMKVLEKYFGVVKDCIDDSDTKIGLSMFASAVLLHHLCTVKSMDYACTVGEASKQKYTRAALLFERFCNLIEDNINVEHEVAFYADSLSITPHYLTMVSNKYSGKSASQLIAEELMSRSRQMLRDPNVSLYDISKTLNFSDQSSFGKFFKKHSGITPASYRREFM